MTKLARLVMHRSTSGVEPFETGFETRLLAEADGELLGHLLYHAYAGTVDDEGLSLAQTIAEAKETLAGKWGAVVWQASFVAENAAGAAGLIAVSLVTRFEKLNPLLAYAATHPQYQRQGLAGALIKSSLSALATTGDTELNLVVTESNPARRLYERLGFSAR